MIDDAEDFFENAPCGFVSADRQGRITRVNAILARWVGATPVDLTGRRFSELLTIGGKIFYETHFAPQLRMQGAITEVTLDLACADGARLPVLVNAVERRDAEGQPQLIRYTIFNASERRRYERDLLLAKGDAERAMAAEKELSDLREQFIAVLGHDLRNPLASIASGIHMLEKEPVSERGRRVIGLMGGSISRAAALVDNVMDFARSRLGGGIDLMTIADAPIDAVIDQVVNELRSIAGTRQIVVRTDLASPVAGDPTRIGQLVSNLLSNALTHGSADEPVRVDAWTGDGLFTLSVANGGEPIAAEAMEHLFHPFSRGSVRRNQLGLGLGLYIASEIALAHGGALSVRSDRQETCFTFAMPCSHGSG